MNEIIDGNVFGPANLARREPSLPLKNERSKPKKKQTDHSRRRRSTHKSDEPFTVRVKRRFNSAKVKLVRKLGLYSEQHLFQLGLYVDVLV
jgi:hypothetical protein